MITDNQRSNGKRFSHVFVNGDIRVIPFDETYKAYGVNEIIRIINTEYPENAGVGTVLTHFNLPINQIVTGSRALLARILKQGVFNNEIEIIPLLSFENTKVVEIVKSHTFKSYDDIPEELFISCIGSIKDKESLKNKIIERYAPVMSDKTNEEIIESGVTVRFLKVLR